MPGAATAMIVVADAYGADARLVAFMQYLRVVMVAVVATVVARIWAPGPGAGPSHGVAWLAPVDWWSFGWTLLIIVTSTAFARFLRIPAGTLLVPLALSAVLQGLGVLKIELPAELLVTSYAIIGWSVGLRFTRDILAHAARVLPQVAVSMGVLIASCALIGGALVVFARIDPLTAYLATSPGGADTVAIIAASSKVNVPFVMAVQSARVLVVILIGPPLARWIGGKPGG
jgi:membrane AbrB-like protein